MKINFYRALLSSLLIFFNHTSFAGNPIILKAVDQTLIVNGKKSHVFNIIQPNGIEGYTGTKGDNFDVKLINNTSVPISIHWHGLILPNNQDGVAYVTQLPIPPHSSHDYHFKLVQSGTYWMHSHYKFHEQELMTAPLILKSKDDPYKNDQDVVVMFQDFSFQNPETIFSNLQHHSNNMGAMNMPMKQDLNDVKYDAYLANRRTLNDPPVFHVSAGKKVRLRLINGASATNFWINTGNLSGKAIAADGNSIHPINNNKFQIALAQRMDIEVTIPKNGGAFPILAQPEGTNQQAGFILATEGASIPKLFEIAKQTAPALNDAQEWQLHPLHSIATKPVNAVLHYKLTGNMSDYIWKINDEIWPRIKPLHIKKGDRVEMVFTNDTSMAHPMHLHGHVFQVSEIDGKQMINGPLRDTILVLPHSTKKIIFDATNPGIWMLHCHVLYHMFAGMMTTTNYQNYPSPSYYEDLINGKIKDE